MIRTKRKLIWELILPQGDVMCQCYSVQHSSSTTASAPSLLSQSLCPSRVLCSAGLSDTIIPPPLHGLVFLLNHSSPLECVTNSCWKAVMQMCHQVSGKQEPLKWKKNAGFNFTKVNVIIVISHFREGQYLNFNLIFTHFLLRPLLLCDWLYFLFGHLVPLALCSLSLCLYWISVYVPSVFPRKSNCPPLFVSGGI